MCTHTTIRTHTTQSGYVHVIHEESDDNYMKDPYYNSTNRTKLKPYTQHKSVSFQSTSFKWQLIRRFLNIKAVFCTWKLYFKTKRNKNTFLSTFVCECCQHNSKQQSDVDRVNASRIIFRVRVNLACLSAMVVNAGQCSFSIIINKANVAYHTLYPCLSMQALWASIKSWQFSSPFSMTHSSRGTLVSGQAQHGLHLGSAACSASVILWYLH